MLNGALYKREMKGSIKLLIILCAVITLYVSVIISMYEPELAKLLDSYVELLPEMMAAVGMKAGATSLVGFMCDYLYGFILIIFPMLFCFLRGNGLIAKYVDNSSMFSLLAAPVRRWKVALTQMFVMISGICILCIYTTILEYVCAEHGFPGELELKTLLALNCGLFCLHLFIGGICFLASCIFSNSKYSAGFGVGIPIFMYAEKMLVNMGGSAEKAKYFTFFSLFNPEGIASGESGAMIGATVLFTGGIVLFVLGVLAFSKKDLHI